MIKNADLEEDALNLKEQLIKERAIAREEKIKLEEERVCIKEIIKIRLIY